MRPPYDEYDGFDFADNFAVRKILREQRREQMRMSKRRALGPRDEDSYDDYDDIGRYSNLDDHDVYDDYNDDEFDTYAGIAVDH